MTMLDLSPPPRESTPPLPVVVDLNRQSLATLLSDNLQYGSDRLSIRRTTRPAAHDAPIRAALLKNNAQVSLRRRSDGRFDSIRAFVRKRCIDWRNREWDAHIFLNTEVKLRR